MGREVKFGEVELQVLGTERAAIRGNLEPS